MIMHEATNAQAARLLMREEGALDEHQIEAAQVYALLALADAVKDAGRRLALATVVSTPDLNLEIATKWIEDHL